MNESISVVIPVYNDGEGLASTLKNLVPVLRRGFSDYETVIVESGSTDGSGEIADKAGKSNKRIKVIHQGEKKGYGNAIREGWMHCSKNFTIYMDCDMPYEYRYIVEAKKYMKDYDAIIGYKSGKRESIARLIVSRGANMLSRILFDIRARDQNYSFKLIKTSFIKKMNVVSDSSFFPAEWSDF